MLSPDITHTSFSLSLSAGSPARSGATSARSDAAAKMERRMRGIFMWQWKPLPVTNVERCAVADEKALSARTHAEGGVRSARLCLRENFRRRRCPIALHRRPKCPRRGSNRLTALRTAFFQRTAAAYAGMDLIAV